MTEIKKYDIYEEPMAVILNMGTEGFICTSDDPSNGVIDPWRDGGEMPFGF